MLYVASNGDDGADTSRSRDTTARARPGARGSEIPLSRGAYTDSRLETFDLIEHRPRDRSPRFNLRRLQASVSLFHPGEQLHRDANHDATQRYDGDLVSIVRIYRSSARGTYLYRSPLTQTRPFGRRAASTAPLGDCDDRDDARRRRQCMTTAMADRKSVV